MMNSISDDDDNNINLKVLPDLHPYSDTKAITKKLSHIYMVFNQDLRFLLLPLAYLLFSHYTSAIIVDVFLPFASIKIIFWWLYDSLRSIHVHEAVCIFNHSHEDEEEVAHGVDQLEELNVDVNFLAIDVNDQLEELN
ncbi:hypothetical protein QVD17_39853 [Tagetes erecta]|uniref:Uncharacterized protein n=1 Tax=Tagetes erecta TaxID=13708 RepID=A0AAD8JQU2_TARER|nr:hypothetical protein QVD17_39853 [Tagetes erecta]